MANNDRRPGIAEAGYRLLCRVIDVRREELPALLWCWLYIFAVLSSYYIMRPIRDEMGSPVASTIRRGCLPAR